MHHIYKISHLNANYLLYDIFFFQFHVRATATATRDIFNSKRAARDRSLTCFQESPVLVASQRNTVLICASLTRDACRF